MNGKLILYLEQFEQHSYARTVKELREKIGTRGSSVARYMLMGAMVSLDISGMS